MDIVDEANDRVLRRIEEGIARAALWQPAKGHPGDCDLCGEWSGRLVLGVCASCRDKRGLE